MPGITEVAALAKVSTATVSRALNGKGHVSEATRRRVQSAAYELGYVISANASALATGRTKNVGVVIPFLGRWFFSAVIAGAESALLERGYDLTLYNLGGGRDERRSVFEHFLLRKRVDAVIAVCLQLSADEVGHLLDLGVPIVGVGAPLPGLRTVGVDDAAMARVACEHLIGLGHRRIAHIGAERDSAPPSGRLLGYEAALVLAGLPTSAALCTAADPTLPGGYRAAQTLLADARARPTALFAASDEMAIGAILAAHDLGLDVPRDVSVIGIDDHELSAFFGLSTIAQFPAEQGRRAVEYLMDELHPRGLVPVPVLPLRFELVVRTSTGACPD